MFKCQYENLKDLLGELDWKRAPESWYRNWELSMAAFPGDDIYFLKDDYIREANNVLRLKPAKVESLLSALNVIRKSAALRHLAWLWYYIIFLSTSSVHETDVSGWPTPASLMGVSSDMLHAVVLVAGLRQLLKFYETRNIPFNVMVETLSDLEICMEEYRERYGEYGIGTFRMGWLLHHFTGRLYRLGRLQYMYREFDGCIRMFRNIRSGEIAALCESGVEFGDDGKINGTNNITCGKGIWKSEYSEGEDFYTGNPVMANGYPVKEPVKLLKKEWKLVLSKGDGLLDVHIPRGTGLTYDLCHKSYDKAVEFFSSYFPEKHFKGFTCRSWLLCPDLRQLLPEESNIIKFQRDFYLYPIKGDESVYEYVFGGKPDNLSDLPAQTSLQRAIKNYLLKGNHIISTGGVILKA